MKGKNFKFCRMNTYAKMGRASFTVLPLFLAAFALCATPAQPPAQNVPPVSRPADGSAASPQLAEARALLQQARIAEAEQAVRRYLADQPESPDGHYLLGLILFRQIQSGASLEGLTQGAQYNPLDPELTAAARKNAAASLAEYTAGARYRKPSAADLKIVALDYIILGDYADADKWLTQALEWNSRDADSWYYLGRTKYSENRFAEAIRAFQKCLELDPKNIKAEDNLGLSYEGLGKIDEAIAAYQTAISWQEGNGAAGVSAGPYLDLGSLLLDQNRSRDALPPLQRAAEIAPRESRAHEKLGKAYAEPNRLSEAQKELEEAVKLAPGNGRLHFMLGQVYRRQGLLEKAKAEMELSGRLDGGRYTP